MDKLDNPEEVKKYLDEINSMLTTQLNKDVSNIIVNYVKFVRNVTKYDTSKTYPITYPVYNLKDVSSVIFISSDCQLYSYVESNELHHEQFIEVTGEKDPPRHDIIYDASECTMYKSKPLYMCTEYHDNLPTTVKCYHGSDLIGQLESLTQPYRVVMSIYENNIYCRIEASDCLSIYRLDYDERKFISLAHHDRSDTIPDMWTSQYHIQLRNTLNYDGKTYTYRISINDGGGGYKGLIIISIRDLIDVMYKYDKLDSPIIRNDRYILIRTIKDEYSIIYIPDLVKSILETKLSH